MAPNPLLPFMDDHELQNLPPSPSPSPSSSSASSTSTSLSDSHSVDSDATPPPQTPRHRTSTNTRTLEHYWSEWDLAFRTPGLADELTSPLCSFGGRRGWAQGVEDADGAKSPLNGRVKDGDAGGKPFVLELDLDSNSDSALYIEAESHTKEDGEVQAQNQGRDAMQPDKGDTDRKEGSTGESGPSTSLDDLNSTDICRRLDLSLTKIPARSIRTDHQAHQTTGTRLRHAPFYPLDASSRTVRLRRLLEPLMEEDGTVPNELQLVASSLSGSGGPVTGISGVDNLQYPSSHTQTCELLYGQSPVATMRSRDSTQCWAPPSGCSPTPSLLDDIPGLTQESSQTSTVLLTPIHSSASLPRTRPIMSSKTPSKRPPLPVKYHPSLVTTQNRTSASLLTSSVPTADHTTSDLTLPLLAMSSMAPQAMQILHVSSDGGPVEALRRFLDANREQPSLSGFSLFLHCPKKRVPHRSSSRMKRQKKVVDEWNGLMGSRPIYERKKLRVVAHAAHTMNLASADPSKRLWAFLSLKAEMEYARALGIDVVVFHPGSTGDNDVWSGLERLRDDVVSLMRQVPDVLVAVENSTHRCRGQVGRSLLELKWLREQVGPRLRICLDLCHLYVDQYDLAIEGGRARFFRDLELLGVENVIAIHVSDSHERHGGKKDLHADLGMGYVGLEGMRAVLGDPRLLNRIPYLLEIPPYHRSNRVRNRVSRCIDKLEEQRQLNEREALSFIVTTPKHQWDKSKSAWWSGHCKRKRLLERRIDRLVSRKQRDEEDYSIRADLRHEKWRKARWRRRIRNQRTAANR